MLFLSFLLSFERLRTTIYTRKEDYISINYLSESLESMPFKTTVYRWHRYLNPSCTSSLPLFMVLVQLRFRESTKSSRKITVCNKRKDCI